jgi:predicted nucleotidyltransferase
MEQLIDQNSTNISRELRRLEQMGTSNPEREQILDTTRSIKNTPSYEELKWLFLKTVGAPAEIKEALKGIEGIETAFIYGSLAKGEEISGSDIDLLIVGNIDEDKLVESLPSLERRLGRGINYSVYGLEELGKKKRRR